MTADPIAGDDRMPCAPTTPVEPVPTGLIDTSRNLYRLAARRSELAETVDEDYGDMAGSGVDTHRLRFAVRGLAVDIVIVYSDVTRMVARVTPPDPVRATVVTPLGSVTFNSEVGIVVAEVRNGPTSVRFTVEGPDGHRRVHTDWFIA